MYDEKKTFPFFRGGVVYTTDAFHVYINFKSGKHMDRKEDEVNEAGLYVMKESRDSREAQKSNGHRMKNKNKNIPEKRELRR